MASFHPFYDAVLEAAVDHARVRVMRTLLDTLNAPRDAVGGAARLGLSASARFRRSAARNRSALRRQRNSLTILPFYQRRRLPVEKRYPRLDRVVCATPLGTPLEVQLEDLDRFAKEVMPAFRRAKIAAAAE